MKGRIFCMLVFAVVMSFAYAPSASAGVDVHIGIGLPSLVISAPPAVVLIPGTYAYFIPDIEADIMFYGGFWWRPYGGVWYRSAGYNGPWGQIAIASVPPVLVNLPPKWKSVPPGHQKIPYGQLKNNWKAWEREKHWDKGGPMKEMKGGKMERGEMGPGMKGPGKMEKGPKGGKKGKGRD